MTLPNRKTLRAEVATKLERLLTGTSTYPLANELGADIPPVPPATDPTPGPVLQKHVFPNFTKDPGGISPFACVDSGSVLYDVNDNDGIPTPMILIIGFWAKRDDVGGEDDMLDDLALALATMIKDNYNARFVTQSVTDNEVLAGVPYKFELHFVEFSI